MDSGERINHVSQMEHFNWVELTRLSAGSCTSWESTWVRAYKNIYMPQEHMDSNRNSRAQVVSSLHKMHF